MPAAVHAARSVHCHCSWAVADRALATVLRLHGCLLLSKLQIPSPQPSLEVLAPLAAAVDTMASLWSFLKLAPHAPVFTHYPGALTHVLKVGRW